MFYFTCLFNIDFTIFISNFVQLMLNLIHLI